MAKDILQIIVDFATRGTGDLKDAGEHMDRLKASGDVLKKSMGLAAGGLATVGAAAYATWQALESGGALETTRTQFDNLTNSIGSTSGALLGDLKTATKGMMSDAALMNSANEIIGLGLASNAEGVARMATAVGALNLDMQVLGLTLANNSAARLDSLGLSLESVKQKAEELKASGFVGDAFDEAVLIGLEERMTLLGDASETTAGKIAQLQTTGENIKNAGLESFAITLAEELYGASAAAGDAEANLVQMASNAGAALANLIGIAANIPSTISETSARMNIATFERMAEIDAEFGVEGRWDEQIKREKALLPGTHAGYNRGAFYGEDGMTSAFEGYRYSGNNFSAATSGYSGGVQQVEIVAGINEAEIQKEKDFLDKWQPIWHANAAAENAATTDTMSYGGYRGGGGGTTNIVGIDLEENKKIFDEFKQWAEQEVVKVKIDFVGMNGETLQDAIIALGGS